MPEIGETLRETRMRRRIDMTEVEAATKIRAKYLRALENEEWDLLPGPTFVKTFLRTYAEYLDLDPRLLVEEYRQRYERPSSQDLTPFGPGLGSQRRRRRQRPRRNWGPAIVVVLGVIVLLARAVRAVAARRRGQRADDAGGHADAHPHAHAEARRRRRRRPSRGADARLAAARSPPARSTSASRTRAASPSSTA